MWINILYFPFLIFGIYNFATLRPQYSECYSSAHPEDPSDPILDAVVFINICIFVVGLQTFVPYYNVKFTLYYVEGSGWWILQLLLYAGLVLFYTIFISIFLSTDGCKDGPPINILAKFPYEYGWFIVTSIFLVAPPLMGIVGLLCAGMYNLCRTLYVPKFFHSENTLTGDLRPPLVDIPRNASANVPCSRQGTLNSLLARYGVIRELSGSSERCSRIVDSEPSRFSGTCEETPPRYISSTTIHKEMPPPYDDICSTPI